MFHVMMYDVPDIYDKIIMKFVICKINKSSKTITGSSCLNSSCSTELKYRLAKYYYYFIINVYFSNNNGYNRNRNRNRNRNKNSVNING